MNTPIRPHFFVSVLALSFTQCADSQPAKPSSSDGTRTEPTDSRGVNPAHEAGADADSNGSPGAEPWYVVSTVVYSGDVAQGYLATVRSLESGSTLTLDQAVEVPESIIASRPGDAYFYSATIDDPIITRWAIDRDGSFKRGPSISFAGLGITHAWALDSAFFHSADRAYFTDDAGQQIVIWNPEAMEIVGTIPLDVPDHGGLVPSLALTARADRLFVVVSWEGDFSEDWTLFGDHVRVIEIDPSSNRVLSATDEPRCNSFTWASHASDGTTYFSPMSWYAPIRSLVGAGRGVDNCALRVVPKGVNFDSGYQVELSGLTDGRPAGTLFIVDDDTAFLRVWHSELVDPVASDKSNWEDVLNQAGFLWWRWQIGTPKATLVPDQEPSASEVSGLFEVDSHKFVPRVNADYSQTVLDELTASGGLRSGLVGPGLIRGVAQVR